MCLIVEVGVSDQEKVRDAIAVLVSELKKCEGYRYSWRANVAMAFVDEFDSHHRHLGVHAIANKAADRFLDMLCGVKGEENESCND
jgi:hypothetical protein